MNDPNQPVLPAQPWYSSPVQVNLVAAGISQAASVVLRLVAAFGYEIKIGAADVDAIGANGAQLVAFLFMGIAWWKRQRSTIAPLTMTAKGAEARTAANPPVLSSDPTKVPK